MRFALIAALVLCGCSTTKDKALEIVKEGRALLRHPAPGDGDWETRRAMFLNDADVLIPSEESK